MSRPHAEFLQSQTLPWTSAPWPQLQGCQAKLLSRDADSGAATALVRLPPGWTAEREGWVSAGTELLVIDGELDLNGRLYGQDCYACLPAGYPYRSLASGIGAVALVFFDGEPVWHEGVPPPGAPTGSGAIEMEDAWRMPWSAAGLDPTYAEAGLRWKFLRGSPAGPAATFLLSVPPHAHPPGWAAPQEVHECTEEIYVLSGDWLGYRGAMAAGAYVWRPAGIAHGPHGSRGGALLVVRTSAGPLAHHWTSHHVRLSRIPAFQPVVPEAQRSPLRVPWRPQNY
jgi:hypothetical protein